MTHRRLDGAECGGVRIDFYMQRVGDNINVSREADKTYHATCSPTSASTTARATHSGRASELATATRARDASRVRVETRATLVHPTDSSKNKESQMAVDLKVGDL